MSEKRIERALRLLEDDAFCNRVDKWAEEAMTEHSHQLALLSWVLGVDAEDRAACEADGGEWDYDEAVEYAESRWANTAEWDELMLLVEWQVGHTIMTQYTDRLKRLNFSGWLLPIAEKHVHDKSFRHTLCWYSAMYRLDKKRNAERVEEWNHTCIHPDRAYSDYIEPDTSSNPDAADEAKKENE